MTIADDERDPVFGNGPPIRLHRMLGLAGRIERGEIRRALVVALLCWVPAFVLTGLGEALSWRVGLASFASDVAFHTRSLVAAPLLVFAETFSGVKLRGIAQHFLDGGLVPAGERARFESSLASTQRLRDAPLAELVVALLAYATAFALLHASNSGPAWRGAGSGPTPLYSLAGWWHALVSLPILLELVFGWIFRTILWTRFLWLVSRIPLRLVPAHPDLTAGMRFLGYSVRALSPVALGFGCIVAGTAANGVLVRGDSLAAYRYAALALVLFVVVLFCAPLLVFIPRLLDTWRRGVFQYTAIADAVGREFERKWFDPQRVDESVLQVEDFSATTDLYQVVANVYEMKLIPLDLRSVIVLVVAALLPFVPVILVALPFHVVLAKLATFLR